MNRIVLIGNGFDLAHGLKTRYEDFINWYWDQRLHGIILEHQAVSADELCSMKIYPTSGYDNWYLFSCGNSYFKNPFKNEWNITGREFIEELESKPDCFDIKYSPFLKNIKTKGWVDIENECLRHIKSIHYMESDNYRKVLEFIEADTFQIIIMGHSCGNSDRTLLNTLFEHRNCVSIKPYYYIKGEDNYLELIQNISRNFTGMKLMRDRVVNKTYCETIS